MAQNLKIYVSQQSFDDEDEYEIVSSNIDLLNALLNEYLNEDEIHPASLQSYYVDYYHAQVHNGGFSQFVYNTGANGRIFALVEQGLAAMGAEQNLDLFRRAISSLQQFDEAQMEAFLNGEYFGENETRDILNQVSDDFFDLDKQENLIDHNGQWLKHHPDIHCVQDEEEWQRIVADLVAAIPNLEERKAAAKAARSRYAKLIDALCQAFGLEFVSINAGDFVEYQGNRYLAWYFSTDQGTRYMLDFGGEAAIFDYKNQTEIGRIDAGGFDPE